MVREGNVGVLGKWLELLSSNGGRFEIDQQLYETIQHVADSEKLCRLVNGLCRVCERIKTTMNVGQSRVIRCSRYGNGGRIHMILNGEPLKEVNCFKYLGSQVAANGGCERDLVCE